MDVPIRCLCGNDRFWFMGNKVRCVSCYDEYKKGRKYVSRRPWNAEDNRYGKWERFWPFGPPGVPGEAITEAEGREE
jgi:hypothetical protein